MAKEKKSSVRSMHIEKMEGGFQTTASKDQPDRGSYQMPESKIHKSHGSVMHDVHEMVHGHGSSEPAEDEEPCPMCAAPVAGKVGKPGGGKTEKPAKAEKSSSTLSEKAAKVAR